MVTTMSQRARKPDWLRVRAPGGEGYHRIRRTLHQLQLHTVCEQARCPNVGTCWREGTATVMVLGEICSRGCRFCAVGSGKPGGVVDRDEPARVAEAVARLELRYVVLTMVTRDDLSDGGAAIVAETIERLHRLRPDLMVEALVSDFGGDQAAIDRVIDAEPEVFGHNIEVVQERTAAVRDRRCSYQRSLEVLAHAKERGPQRPTKSSLMVGVGETDEQVLAALRDLRAVGVDLVTIGQYLQPSGGHHEVSRFVTPDSFEGYRRAAEAMGFAYVASGPLVRSSYRAAEGFVQGWLREAPPDAGVPGRGEAPAATAAPCAPAGLAAGASATTRRDAN